MRSCPRAVFALTEWLAKLAFTLFKGFRKRSVVNIGAAFDLQDQARAEAIARRSLRNFFRSCVELVQVIVSSDQELHQRIGVVGREHLDNALAKGNGVLVLSAHLGNFFLVGCRLAIDGYPVAVLVNQPRDGRFAELLDRYRLQARQRTIHARPRRQALREMNEVLRRNEMVVIIADEFRRSDGIPVSFFGFTVNARRGPVTLALRTGAAVVPAVLVRQTDDSLKLVIGPELVLTRESKGKDEIRENTVRMTQWLEASVRAYPDQWNWMNIRSTMPATSVVEPEVKTNRQEN